MKFLVVGVFLFVALVQVKALTDKQKELLAQHYKQCVELSKVDPTVLQKARSGDFANDDKLKQHILCIAKKSGFQNEAGVLQRSVIKTKLKEALKGDEVKTQELVNTCAVAKPDPKLQAFEAFKCIYQKAKINLL
ncbi:hypothetical protein ABEB36_003271 [Hypothenemus hampei]|uniref:Uncharacterized protein n=1 Tax=Hypothenemus hampei TaxID=57062 RepID=A0ABD1F8N0_HYPHA